jgi:glycosyltransferase involved in cell wall biosynthesis
MMSIIRVTRWPSLKASPGTTDRALHAHCRVGSELRRTQTFSVDPISLCVGSKNILNSRTGRHLQQRGGGKGALYNRDHNTQNRNPPIFDADTVRAARFPSPIHKQILRNMPDKCDERRRTVCLVSRCSWTFYNFRLALAEQLSTRTGCEIVAAGIDTEGYGQRISSRGIRFVGLRGRMHGQNPLYLLLFFFDLYRLYRNSRPAVVHHFTIKPVIFGTLAARLAGVPKIVNTISGLGQAFSEESKATGYLAKFLYWASLRYSAHVFFQNEDDRTLFIDAGLIRNDRTSVVPGSGVDVERFAPLPMGTEDDSPSVLMVARLLKPKGVEEFVRAASLIRTRNPQVQFTLLGGLDFGNPAAVERADLDRWVQEGLIRWVGHSDDVRPFIARAHVVVLPSYYREGVPRALLEAAAMGKPIVTTDNTGCREVVDAEVNGIIVPPRDGEALAAAIDRLLRDRGLRQRMGEAGRAKMRRDFDERLIVDRTILAYDLCRT